MTDYRHDRHGPPPTRPRTTWHPTACILCECNCGIEVRLGADGRTLRTHPRRQGAPGVEGLHVREGAAARLLPERSRRAAAQPAAPPRRRHLRGDRLGHRHPRGRRAAGGGPRHPWRRGDRLLRRRRPGQPPRRHLRLGDAERARRPVPDQRHRAGEDRRDAGDGQDVRHAAARRLRALRGRVLPRQEPVDQPRHPARPHHAEGDRRRSRTGRWS